MKKIIFAFFFLISIYNGYSQTWSYAAVGENFGGYNNISCSLKDDADNIYIAGNFEECYHCDGANGIFVSKILPTGLVVWTDTITNRPHYSKIFAKNMFFKDDGSLSLSGYITDTINFMGYILNRDSLRTGFFAEFDITGNCLNASVLPYVPLAVIKNTDHTLSIAGQTSVPVSDLVYLPPSGNFVGNFNDYSDANWIGDLPGIFSSSTDVPAMVSSPQNVIYIVNPSGGISKHTSLTTSTVSTTWFHTLKYINNKLYGFYGDYLLPGTINILDTNGLLLQQRILGGYGNMAAFGRHAQGLAFMGVFKDSLTYNGLSYYSDSSGLFQMYVIEVDSNLVLQNFQIIKQTYLSSCVIVPQFILSNDHDLFIQGYIGGQFIFGSDTLSGSCEGASSYFYSRLSLGIAASVNELKNEEDISVYPNPASEIFTIDLKNRVETKICIYDVLGHCVLDNVPINKSDFKIDLSSQSKGIYFLQMVSGGEKKIKKIILN